jgi:O-antigen/teichoic acid export membrane protein
MSDAEPAGSAVDELRQAAGHRVARNTLVLIVLRLVVPLLSLALVFTLSRVLGAEGLGRYTLVFSFLALLGGLGPLGLPTVVTRDGTADRSMLNALLRNSMTLGAVASLSLTLLMMASGPLFAYDAETRSGLMILSLAIFPYTFGMLLDGAIVALERMQYMAAATLAEYLFKVVIAVIFLMMGFGLNAVLVTAVVGRVVGCLVSAHLLRRAGVRAGWSFDPEVIRKLLHLAPTFLFTMIFATLYWRIDILMLSKLASVEDLGYYGAAYRLFELAAVFPQSLCLSLYPQIVAAVQADRKHLRDLGRSALRYLLVVTLPAAVVLTALSGEVLGLLYGSKFDAAATTLSVLIWTILPFSLVRYHAYVLVAANRQNVDLTLNVIMSLVNVAFNFLLIPRYSYLGAACATFASVCLLALLQYGYVRRYLPGHAATVSLPLIVVVATALAGTCAWLLQGSNVLIPIFLAPVLYVAILFFGGFFTTSELKFLRIYRLVHRCSFAEKKSR